MGCIKPPLAVSEPTQRAAGRLAFGAPPLAPSAEPAVQAAAMTTAAEITTAKQVGNRASAEIQRASSVTEVDRSLARARSALEAAMAKTTNPSEKQSLRDRLRSLEAKANTQRAEIALTHEREIRNSLPINVAPDLRFDTRIDLAVDDVIHPGELVPNAAYVYNSYVYVTDSNGAQAYVHGEAVYTPNAPRHPAPQAEVGHQANAARGTERTFVGGHSAAVSLGGHPSGPGLFGQDSNMNVSAFATLEGEFRDRARAGDQVEFSIRFGTDSPSDSVPSVAMVEYSFNGGESTEIALLNEPNQFK